MKVILIDSIYSFTIPNIQKTLESSCWIIDFSIDHDVNISQYNPLAGSSYIKLLKKLIHLKKPFINIPNIDDDDKYIKWCLVRYLYLAHNPRRIGKADKYFAKKLQFKDIKLPIKFSDIHKIERSSSISITFKKYLIYVSKK